MLQPVPPVSSRPNRSNGHSATSDSQYKAVSLSDEAIAERAYEKFIARGSAHGFDQQDWASATQELLAEARRYAV